MSSSSARALLLILLKSNQNAKATIPSTLSDYGSFQHYKSIMSNNDQRWTDALVSVMNNEEELQNLDTKTVYDAVRKEYNAENILIAPMVYSVECVKDKSIDPINDIFFAVAFTVKERLDQFPQDWLKATPYMSSCSGFKRATIYKVTGDNPLYPFINIAIWASLDSWKQAIAAEESKQAHAHQNHIQRTPFIGKLFQSPNH